MRVFNSKDCRIALDSIIKQIITLMDSHECLTGSKADCIEMTQQEFDRIKYLLEVTGNCYNSSYSLKRGFNNNASYILGMKVVIKG